MDAGLGACTARERRSCGPDDVVRPELGAAGELDVAVVVLAWNSGPELSVAVRSALADGAAEVLIVDNASSDGAPAQAAKLGARVRLILLARNVGFAAACNIGVAATRAPLILFLNDDAQLVPGYLAALRAALLRAPDAASAVGKLVHRRADGSVAIDSAGLRLDRYALRPSDRGQGERDVGQYDAPREIFGPTGAAALYRRTALVAAGGFDEALFAYYEDVDLAWRLGRAGWRHLYVPAGRALHARRGPAGKPAPITRRAFVNRYTVWCKNESLWRFACYAPVALMWESVRMARLARRDPAAAGSILRAAPGAVWRGLRQRHRQAPCGPPAA